MFHPKLLADTVVSMTVHNFFKEKKLYWGKISKKELHFTQLNIFSNEY